MKAARPNAPIIVRRLLESMTPQLAKEHAERIASSTNPEFDRCGFTRADYADAARVLGSSCSSCGFDGDFYFSRIEPMGYVCPKCGEIGETTNRKGGEA